MNSEFIKQLAREAGFDACGITTPEPISKAETRLREWIAQGKHGQMKYLENYVERSRDFWQKFPTAKSIIVLGVNYYSKDSGREPSRPFPAIAGQVARYAWGKDYHRVVKEKIDLLKNKILEHVHCNIRFEYSVDTKPLLEKPLAVQAGLGFIGKQTQLLSLQFGPWLFLSELITDLELESDVPFQGSCGSCRICIDECPTGAIEENGIDARKCIAYLTIEHKTEIPEALRDQIGNHVFGCDECLNVCPYTIKQKESTALDLKSESGFGPALDLATLFQLKSQSEYEKIFEGTAILRAKRKQLLRNACIVLGNSKDSRAIPILELALNDSSDMVREHAKWALQKLGK